MSVRSVLRLAVPAGLLALALALVLLGRPDHRAPRRASTAKTPVRLTLAMPLATVGPQPQPTRAATGPESGAGPEQVARAFIDGWLACVYRQGSCARIPGSLPAYAAALGRRRGGSLATPAELAARPRVISLRVIRACRNSATAIARYVDGDGERYQLHVNLVLAPAGWRVFDVAEAPPHIPLPKPLTEGPR
ncbi:MAG: hypothetical protein ACRDL5_05245, partial [Solirubrobacteraceae bacterium]